MLRKTDNRRQDHISHIESPIEFYKAIIAGNPVEKTNSWKVQAIVESVRTQGEWINCKANILLYFSKEDFPSFKYGDVLIGKRRTPAGPRSELIRKNLITSDSLVSKISTTSSLLRAGMRCALDLILPAGWSITLF